MEIGQKIKKLRQDKKVTQEELASQLGVSTQAVSKWENGGLPDIALIPNIASFFSVSIDELFSLDSSRYKSLPNIIHSFLKNTEMEKKMQEAFKLTWEIEKGVFSDTEYDNNSFDYYVKDKTNSQMVTQYGVSIVRLHPDNMFFFLSPRPESKVYNYIIKREKEQLALLKMLSDKDYYDSLVHINAHPQVTFTKKWLENLGIATQKVEEILSGFLRFNLIGKSIVSINDEDVDVYNYKVKPELIMLFTALDSLLSGEKRFSYFIHDNQKIFEERIKNE